MQGAQSGSRFRGIGRYAVALGRAMLAEAGEHEISVLLSGRMPEGEAHVRASFADLLPPSRIRCIELPGPVAEADPANHWRMRAAELVREHMLSELGAELVLTFSPCEGIRNDVVTSADRRHPCIATAAILYDLIPLRLPDVYLANPHVHRAYLRRLQSLRQVDLLLSISAFSRAEAIELLDIPEHRLATIGAGVDPFFRPIPDADTALARKGLQKELILYAGAADPRKNLDGLLAAYSLLPERLRSRHQLALVGRMEEAEQRQVRAMARRHGVPAERLACLGYLPDEDLRLLYSASAVFVLPSLLEGFGLPALEAMACGAPTIGSATSSIPEVIGRADALFDPAQPESIASRLQAVLEDAGLAASLRQSGLKTASRFTWPSVARRALASVGSLASHRRPHSSAVSRVRPRLAFVAPLPPIRSGIARYSSRLLPALARYYDITCIVDQEDIAAPDIAANFAVRSADWLVANQDRFDRILYQFGNAPCHRHMFALLEVCPGVVVMHDFHLSGLLAWMARIGGQPSALDRALYESHGYPALVHCRAAGGEAALAYPANASVLRQATRVLVHSHHADALAGIWYGARTAQTVRRVAFLPSANARVDRRAARSRLGVADNVFLVCTFGILHPAKLNHRLLEAWRRSELAGDPACRLAFVGEVVDDTYQRRLRPLLTAVGRGAPVGITGHVADARYADFLAAADVAVQLRTGSHGETSGAMFECLEHGLPLVTNAHGAAGELPEGVAWMIADEFSDIALADAILRLRADPGRRADLGLRAAAHVRAAHHPSVVAKSYRDEIEDAYAMTGAAREQALLAAIRHIEGAPNAADLAAAVAAIVANRPAAGLPRILLDVTVPVVSGDAVPGVGATIAVARTLLAQAPAGWRIEPVWWDGHDYLHASQFTCRLLALGDCGLDDGVVEPAPGDLFLGLDGALAALPHRSHWFHAQRRRGVRPVFLIPNLLPLRGPNTLSPDYMPELRRGLGKAVGLAEGLMCSSRADGETLISWLDTEQRRSGVKVQLGWLDAVPDPTRSMEAPSDLGAAPATTWAERITERLRAVLANGWEAEWPGAATQIQVAAASTAT
jgi:glycosyltransferase involved in cell wall biosynthesis